MLVLFLLNALLDVLSECLLPLFQTTQPNVLMVQPSAPPPNNHMALAIVSCLLCVWPLGLVAIICSSQVSRHNLGRGILNFLLPLT